MGCQGGGWGREEINNIPLYFRVVILNKRYSLKLIYDDVKVVTKQ